MEHMATREEIHFPTGQEAVIRRRTTSFVFTSTGTQILGQ
jgi:hypothetical protein